MNEQLLTVRQVADVLKVSDRTVWRWVGLGRLPEPVRFSQTCVRWKTTDLERFLAAMKGSAPKR